MMTTMVMPISIMGSSIMKATGTMTSGNIIVIITITRGQRTTTFVPLISTSWQTRLRRFWRSPLTLGGVYGWTFLDPVMGIVGAVVIARWSWGLIRDAGGVLLDYVPIGEDLPDDIRAAVETRDDRIVDLHVWQLGPGHRGAIVSIRSTAPKPLAFYRKRLERISDLSHVTVEVEAA